MPKVSGLALSAATGLSRWLFLMAQTDIPKASLHFYEWEAIQDGGVDSDLWGGQDPCWTVPPVEKPLPLFWTSLIYVPV